MFLIEANIHYPKSSWKQYAINQILVFVALKEKNNFFKIV